ncbi:unnamed protein product, partial [Effrenium voratum]
DSTLGLRSNLLLPLLSLLVHLLSGAPGPRAPPLGLARLRGEAREAGAGQRPGGAGLRRFVFHLGGLRCGFSRRRVPRGAGLDFVVCLRLLLGDSLERSALQLHAFFGPAAVRPRMARSQLAAEGPLLLGLWLLGAGDVPHHVSCDDDSCHPGEPSS